MEPFYNKERTVNQYENTKVVTAFEVEEKIMKVRKDKNMFWVL